MRYVIHVDEDGSVEFDFEHEQLQNPTNAGFNMAKLLVMMHNGGLHDLAMDGIKNRAMQGDNVANIILENYTRLYQSNDSDKPCVSPGNVFNLQGAINARTPQ